MDPSSLEDDPRAFVLNQLDDEHDINITPWDQQRQPDHLPSAIIGMNATQRAIYFLNERERVREEAEKLKEVKRKALEVSRERAMQQVDDHFTGKSLAEAEVGQGLCGLMSKKEFADMTTPRRIAQDSKDGEANSKEKKRKLKKKLKKQRQQEKNMLSFAHDEDEDQEADTLTSSDQRKSLALPESDAQKGSKDGSLRKKQKTSSGKDDKTSTSTCSVVIEDKDSVETKTTETLGPVDKTAVPSSH